MRTAYSFSGDFKISISYIAFQDIYISTENAKERSSQFYISLTLPKNVFQFNNGNYQKSQRKTVQLFFKSLLRTTLKKVRSTH
uniref:Uncharacterized protein n=1 Tax=Anguilla anguilla TaxID=7936 RepID=A0A0E9SXQ7_ANGAN